MVLNAAFPNMTGNDTTHPELSTDEVIRWNKVAWMLATQKQLTIIYCSMFRLHTIARVGERERVNFCKGLRIDTKRHPNPIELSVCKFLTTDRLTTFSKFANFHMSKFRIFKNDAILLNYCVISYMFSNSLFSFPQSNL